MNVVVTASVILVLLLLKRQRDFDNSHGPKAVNGFGDDVEAWSKIKRTRWIPVMAVAIYAPLSLAASNTATKAGATKSA